MLSNTCETAYFRWERNTEKIQSNEGTPPPPHRDAVAMGMCATGLFPLLHLNETSNEMNERTKRLAFVDYFTGVGKLQESRSWWIVS